MTVSNDRKVTVIIIENKGHFVKWGSEKTRTGQSDAMKRERFLKSGPSGVRVQPFA
jgi:hypothetical protein